MPSDYRNSVKYRHHGVLFLFWISAFLYEWVPVINWVLISSKNDNDWSQLDIVENFLNFMRIAYLVVLLCIALYAPGLCKKNDNQRLDDLEDLVAEKEPILNEKFPESNKKRFFIFFENLKFLWPYMWPTGEPLTQIAAVSSMLCLVLGRVNKVLIPIYLAKIVDALSQGSGDLLTW